MNKPSVDEIVAWFETLPQELSRVPNRYEMEALIADWRKRGEALRAMSVEAVLMVEKEEEAMRAKCEAIARRTADNPNPLFTACAEIIADAIAALKQS